MGQEFEDQDLSGASFWAVDLSGAAFRDVNFTGASMRSVWLRDVNIDGIVERLVINGVDVTDHVRANDPWGALRAASQASTRDELLAAAGEMERAWADAIERARALPDARRHESVGGEWSFVQTLCHLVFAIDKWFTHPVTGGSFHQLGLPNTGSVDFPWPGIDRGVTASFDEAVAAFVGRTQQVVAHIHGATDDDLQREVQVLENGPHCVVQCIQVVFEEQFEHLRYALRDLAAMG
jgi:hypothetical protein